MQIHPWNEATPLIRTLWQVPRVAGLEGVHCRSPHTIHSWWALVTRACGPDLFQTLFIPGKTFSAHSPWNHTQGTLLLLSLSFTFQGLQGPLYGLSIPLITAIIISTWLCIFAAVKCSWCNWIPHGGGLITPNTSCFVPHGVELSNTLCYVYLLCMFCCGAVIECHLVEDS